jgi:hypothetical protein
VATPRGTPLANAMLDVAQRFGVEIERLGVSTGRFEV